MDIDAHLNEARRNLTAARSAIATELATYPTPVSGCDAQYTHLLSLRTAVSNALDVLATPQFIPTPRTLTQNAGVESR